MVQATCVEAGCRLPICPTGLKYNIAPTLTGKKLSFADFGSNDSIPPDNLEL
jgi:hypothetical protein